MLDSCPLFGAFQTPNEVQMSQPTQVTITKNDIVEASRRGAMSPQDVESLWAHLATQAAGTRSGDNSKSFDIAQLAWYGGGVLVMIAMAWFMERAATLIGSGGVLALSLTYAAAFAGLGYKLKYSDGQKTPGGLLFTLAVLMTPIAAFAGMELGFAEAFSPDKKALIAEVATIAVGLLAVSHVRSSLLSAPIFGALWCLSMTVAGIVSPGGFFSFFGSQGFLQTSMAIGAGILATAFVTDSKFGREEDYSWWGYFFGVLAFWVPMSLMDTGSELGKLGYFGINLVMVLMSVVLARKVFLVAGAIGSIGYIGHLLWTYFSGSLAFPVALIACGIGIIYLGVAYRRNQARIEGFVLGLVPAGIRARLPRS